MADRSPAGKKRIILVASTILTAVGNTGALLLIARNMGVEILGALGFMLAYVGLFFFLGDLAYGLAFVKVLDKGHPFKDCYSAYLMSKIKFTVALGVVSGIMIGVYVLLLAPETHTPIHPMSMFAILGYFLVVNMAQIWVVSFRAKGRETTAKSYDLLEALGKFGLLLGAISLALTGIGDQAAVLQVSAIYMVAAVLGLMVIRNNARRFRRFPVDDEVQLEFHDISKSILPFFALGAILINLDKVLLWYFTDFRTLGLYFGAQLITVFIAASSVVIQGIIGGAIDLHLKREDKDAVRDTLRMTERYVTLVGLPIAAFYIYFPDDVLGAFLGNDFVGGGFAVSLLAAAGLFTALASPHIAYMIRDSKFGPLSASVGLSFLTLVIILVLFLPENLLLSTANLSKMDITASAVLASSFVGFITVRLFTAIRLECRPHPRILAHILCTGITVVTLTFTAWYFEITAEVHRVLVFAGLGVIIYGVCLYLAGEFLQRDYRSFKELTKDD